MNLLLALKGLLYFFIFMALPGGILAFIVTSWADRKWNLNDRGRLAVLAGVSVVISTVIVLAVSAYS